MNKYTDESIRGMAEYITGTDFWRAGGVRFSDGPAGLRMPGDKREGLGLKTTRPATLFPAHSALACSFNRGLARAVGRAIGEEAAANGADILLAPAVNIKRSPYNGRNFEYFSEDPYLTGELGAAYVEGVQSAGVGACVKHFACNNRETARSAGDSVVSERTLRELYLSAFEHIVKTARPAAVMTSYNKLNGVYCNENHWLLGGVLRGEWGFDGLIISDWGGTYDRVQSVKAGADVEMPACPVSTEILVEAYGRGEISGEEIEACANRLKAAAARPKPQTGKYDGAAHAELAYKAACESEVLLKNDGVLPLSAGARVAVFGRAAKNAPVQGGGSSHIQAGGANILSELERVFTVTGYAADCKKYGRRERKLLDGAEAAIVCVAASGDTEGQDKSSLSLTDDSLKLLAALGASGKKIVCLLSCGGAIDTGWDGGVNALLYLGLSGQGTARAAADILCGKVNPSGRLAESFFNDVSELPSAKYFGGAEYYTVYGEELAVGYRYYSASGVSAKYPFGYGLSYTDFVYSELTADENGATFTLTNCGGRSGAETAQVYAKFPEAANEPPRLIGFQKVFLAAGESKTITIPFGGRAFSVYDARAQKYVTVSGKYLVCVSQNSGRAALSAELGIKGECGGVPQGRAQGEPCVPQLKLTKRGRVEADLSTPFGELKNSKAPLTRLFVKCAMFFVRKDPLKSGSLKYSPVKTVAQFASMGANGTRGFIYLLNGNYIEGIKLFLKRGGKTK